MPKRVVTVGRAGSKCANFKSGKVSFSLPIWQTKVYESFVNQHGVEKWRLVDRVGTTRASSYPSRKLIREAMDYAAYEGLEFRSYVAQYDKVS